MAIFSTVSPTAATEFFYENRVFKAITNGTGFTQDDIIIGRAQFNATTGAFIAYAGFNNVATGLDLAAAPAIGTDVVPTAAGALRPLTQEVLTVDATVGGVGFAAKPADANHAVIQIQGAPLRLTLSGTAPTATVGLEQEAGTTFILESEEELNAFLGIRTTAVDSTLFIQYYTRVIAA